MSKRVLLKGGSLAKKKKIVDKYGLAKKR